MDEFLVTIISLGTAILLYLLPTVIAFKRGHRSKGGIAVLNILLGWTILGWIIALIWSFTDPGGKEVTIINVQNVQTGNSNNDTNDTQGESTSERR